MELGKKSGYLDGFSLGKEHGVRLGTEVSRDFAKMCVCVCVFHVTNHIGNG